MRYLYISDIEQLAGSVSNEELEEFVLCKDGKILNANTENTNADTLGTEDTAFYLKQEIFWITRKSYR